MKAVFTISITLISAMVAGCASTAADVKVPTMSMQQAWSSSGTATLDSSQQVSGRTINALVRQDQPLPIVSAPDIRMAYIYQSTDAEGNMHYGSWVAIPVSSFKWLMPEGAAMPMTAPMAPAFPKPAQ